MRGRIVAPDPKGVHPHLYESFYSVQRVGQRLRSLQPTAFASLPKNDQILFAPQKYAVLRLYYADSGIRYIGTFGLAPCVGLVMYRAATRSGIVAHFDSDADDLSSPYSALNVAEALYRSFTASAGGPPSAAHVVQGTMYGAGVNTKAAFYEVCEDHHLSVEYVSTRSGDLVLSLETGAICEINYTLPISAPRWFAMAKALNRSSAGLVRICRLQIPLVDAATYAAP